MFNSIYSWFAGWFGDEFYQFFAGYDCNWQLVNTIHFNSIGIITFAVTIIACLLFYFIRHASFNKWWSWLLVLLLTSIISLFIGWGYTYSHYANMPDWVIYGMANVGIPDGASFVNCSSLVLTDSNATELVTGLTFWQFGIVNMIISAILFFIISIIIKRFSVNCRHTPWKSLWPKN